MSLYQDLAKLGLPMSNHESDLYVAWSPKAYALVRAAGIIHQCFRDSDGKAWIEVPFAYEPFWKGKGAA